MNSAITVVICVVLRLNIAVVNTIGELNALQQVLHLLLQRRMSTHYYIEVREKHTSSRARTLPASMTALVWGRRRTTLELELAAGGA